MNRIRLAAAAVNQTPMAWDTNARHIRAALRGCATPASAFSACRSCASPATAARTCSSRPACSDARSRCLQELRARHGRACRLLRAARVLRRRVVQRGRRGLRRPAAGHRGQAAPGGRRHPLRAALVPPLAGGRRRQRSKSAASEYPIGDLLFDCGGVRIGFEICRDAWVADRTGARLAQRGADVLLNPSASHFAFAKQQIRERFVLEGSRAFCVSYAYANLLGNEAGRSIYDGGTLIATGGKMLARGPRFSFADWLLTTAVIDVDSTRRAKAESFPDASAACRRTDDAVSIAVEFEYPDVDEPTGSVATSNSGVRWSTGQASARRRARTSGLGNRAASEGRRIRARRWRSHCSTICGRAARKALSFRSAAAPIRRPSPCWFT